MIQAKIESGNSNIKFTWTPNWLLLLTAMEIILADLEKRTVKVKITVTCVENQDSTLKDHKWFSDKSHYGDGLTEIIPNTLLVVCCYFGHITLQYSDIEILKC